MITKINLIINHLNQFFKLTIKQLMIDLIKRLIRSSNKSLIDFFNCMI